MTYLGFLCLLVGASVVYGTRLERFLYDYDSTGINTLCRYPKPFVPAVGNYDTVLYRLRLQHAVIVQTVVIDTGSCDGDRALIEGNFSLHYDDATDVLKQEIFYSDNLFAQWDTYQTKLEITLDPVLYTDHMTLKTIEPVRCSNIIVYGCTPDEICQPDTCKNNGICVGNGICSCQKGFMGDRCESSVSEMPYDNYEFMGTMSNVLFTKDAAFDVSGDVTFDIQPADPDRTARSYYYHHSSHHGSSASFHGYGGSCHHSSSHISGYSSGSHSTYGHHSSNSPHSCISSNHHSGYSHTSSVSYGHNHNHGSTHYYYTTHGTSHHSNGASLHYCNNQLHMHVHNDHQNHNYHQGNHYHVTAPFHPKPGQTYTVCTTYSPHHGAGIYINGHQTATQTKPTPVLVQSTPQPTPVPVQPVPQKPLCFGSCGATSNGAWHNYTLSNLGFAGGSIPFLANNCLLGLLGSSMLNLLLHLHSSTPSPTKMATTHAQGFTLAPTLTTTPPPASATTGHVNGVTSKYGPVCYDCLHVNDPKSCTQKIQCNSDDVCLVFKDKYGYNQRCMSKQDCQKGLTSTTADCWSCCDTNLCNQNCTSALPVSTTPTSPSCKDIDEKKCVSLKQMAAYYNVCADPLYSTTTCKKTCGNCP